MSPARTADERREALVEVYREGSTCTRCGLAETRNTVVFGAGDANADLMFIGEAPGAEEDRRGLPFVGRAGALLDELLAGVGLGRDSVFIANTLMCRPPGNRDPLPAELDACRPYLLEKVRLIEPKVIATLGNFATKLITGNQAGITKVRGEPQIHTIGERTLYVFPILHPAAALRTPSLRETMEADFTALRALIGEPELPQDAERDEPEPEDRQRSTLPERPPEEDQLDFFTS